MIAKAQFTIKDLMDIVAQPTPPENPVVGLLWRNTGVTPNELLAWTGDGTSNARRYNASASGAAVPFADISDDHALDVTVKTVATQAGSGTPSPDNVRAIGGKSEATIRRCGKNLFNPNDVQSGTIDPSTGADLVDVNFSRTPYIGVNPSSQYTISYTGEYVTTKLRCVWYDANKALISLNDAATYTGPNTFTSPANAAFVRIRVRGSFMADTQVETGTTATAYEAYSGTDHTLTPDATLYGVTGYEDEIGNDGHETHKTALVTFNGTEAWSANETLTNTTRFTGNTVLSGGRVISADKVLCSHFNSVYGDTSDTEHCRSSTTGAPEAFVVYINKARIAGWSDAWTTTEKANAFKAWLGTNNIQVLYQLKTPTTATVAPVEINGSDGENTVTSDGASVVVAYTGSGWDAVGAVQRLAIEAVEITPEFGIKVAHVLTDGTNTKNVFTLHNSKGFQFFDAGTGELLGGLFMMNGEVFLFSSALADPRVSTDFMADIFTEEDTVIGEPIDRFGIRFKKGSIDYGGIGVERNATDASQYKTLFLGRGSTRVGISTKKDGVTETSASLWLGGRTTLGWALLESRYAPGGVLINMAAISCDGAYGNVISDGHLLPGADNTYNLGTTTTEYGEPRRWKKVYSNSGTIGTSDEREKHDIHPADPEMLRKFIMELDVEWFRLNVLPNEQMVGFIAQRFREAMRKAGMPDDYGGYVDETPGHSHLMLRYDQVIAPLAAMAKLHEQENQERDRVIREHGRQIEEQGRQIKALMKLVGKEGEWAE